MTSRRFVAAGLAGAALAVMALLPFEPRRPRVRVLGFEFTLLEWAAGLAIVILLLGGRRAILARLRHPPAPVAALAVFAGAHLLSAAFAAVNRGLAGKFALRMVAAAVFAFAVSLAPSEARRRGQKALVCGAVVVAVLAFLEWYPVRALGPFLDLFRETRFVVGGTRRASAASEYPNLAGAFLMYGLVAAGALVPKGRRNGRTEDEHGSSGLRSRGLLSRAGASVLPLLGLGLILTYSRAAIAAGVAGLVVVTLARRKWEGGWTVPAVALAGLAIAAGVVSLLEPSFRLRLVSPGTEGWYGARYEPRDASLRLAPGERHRLPVRVTNTGRDTWMQARSFALAHRWYDAQTGRSVAESLGVRLAEDVPPGASATVVAEVEAPDAEGRYVLLFDLLQAHVGWFSGLGSAPGTVAVSVTAAPDGLPPLPAPIVSPAVTTEWRPGRSELWGLALSMWRDQPLLGVGPDNFRWLYAAYAGRSFADHRTFSNNLFLEAASTTGLLGLLAILTTFSCSFTAVRRQVEAAPTGSAESRSAIAGLGLLAALAVHGLLDYVLAFTGHYLLFAFVIGSVSAGAGAPPDEVWAGERPLRRPL